LPQEAIVTTSAGLWSVLTLEAMVKCTIAFQQEDTKWTHFFEVDEGATILELKQKMLAPRGTKRDVDAFELRLRGQRVSDSEQIFQEHTLDFEYLGPEEGAKKAREDAEEQKALQKAAEEAAKKKAAHDKAEKAKAKAAAQAPPAAKAAAKSAVKPKSEVVAVPDIPGVPLWKVVGGGDKGGILVRQGVQTSSPQLPERLSTGAVVEQLALEGERLHYKRITGTGPEEGWVSLNISGKELMKAARVDEGFTLQRAIQFQKDLLNNLRGPAFTQAMALNEEEFPDKKSSQYMMRRNMIIFGAQRDVLAKYGFDGSQKGVMQMMGAFGPHMSNPEVMKYGDEMNKLMKLG